MGFIVYLIDFDLILELDHCGLKTTKTYKIKTKTDGILYIKDVCLGPVIVLEHLKPYKA